MSPTLLELRAGLAGLGGAERRQGSEPCLVGLLGVFETLLLLEQLSELEVPCTAVWMVLEEGAELGLGTLGLSGFLQLERQGVPREPVRGGVDEMVAEEGDAVHYSLQWGNMICTNGCPANRNSRAPIARGGPKGSTGRRRIHNK